MLNRQLQLLNMTEYSHKKGRKVVRRAGSAKAKAHFEHADTDRQAVSDPRQHSAVRLLNILVPLTSKRRI